MKSEIILIILLFYLTSCSTEENVKFSEYEIITTAKEINNYYNISLDTTGSSEEGRIRKFIDGSYELKYSYDLLETEEFHPLFYSIKIEVEPTASDAIENFGLSKKILFATNKTIGQKVIEIDSLELPGDQNYYAIRTSENKPVGLFFLIRKGNRIYTIIMSGLYSSDHSLILDLVIPKLKDLDNFTLLENK